MHLTCLIMISSRRSDSELMDACGHFRHSIGMYLIAGVGLRSTRLPQNVLSSRAVSSTFALVCGLQLLQLDAMFVTFVTIVA